MKTVFKFFSILLVILFIAAQSPAAYAMTESSEEENQPETTIYELISMTDQLSQLKDAVEAAGLVEWLNEEAPLTVFLPVNQAFESLPDGMLESFMEDEEALRNLIENHVHEGEMLSHNLEDGEQLLMKSGESVEVAVGGAGYEIGNAVIIQVDVDASNGIIHVINEVLIPEN